MEITRCGIHGFHEVLGIDTDKIRLYWVLHSDLKEARQTAYRIVVALSLEALEDETSVWDSGRVDGDEQRDVRCHPATGFRSTTFHYWRVTIWDQTGHAYNGPVNEFFTSYPRSSRLLPPYSMNQTYVCNPHLQAAITDSKDATYQPHIPNLV